MSVADCHKHAAVFSKRNVSHLPYPQFVNTEATNVGKDSSPKWLTKHQVKCQFCLFTHYICSMQLSTLQYAHQH